MLYSDKFTTCTSQIHLVDNVYLILCQSAPKTTSPMSQSSKNCIKFAKSYVEKILPKCCSSYMQFVKMFLAQPVMHAYYSVVKNLYNFTYEFSSNLICSHCKYATYLDLFDRLHRYVPCNSSFVVGKLSCKHKKKEFTSRNRYFWSRLLKFYLARYTGQNV